MNANKNNTTRVVAVVGAVIVTIILVVGTVWMGRSATRDTQQAVRSVSLLYLDELAGRREQVVASNLQKSINDMQVGIELMGEDDLSDLEHLQAYQARMKRLLNLERFAFVDANGLIYTALGPEYNIDDYNF